MDPANVREALKEVALDLEEGADMVMVKPALSYLDVIRPGEGAVRRAGGGLQRLRRVRDGEGGRRRTAGSTHDRVMMEILTSIKRAGADLILTYHALEAAELLDS